MRPIRKIAVTLVAALGLGIAATAAHAHPGWGGGPGAQAMEGRYGGGPGMGPMGGWYGGAPGMGPMGGGRGGFGAGMQLMTPEERTALIEKMRNAKTPEERQQIAAANHAEMQKRASEKGVTLPEQTGPCGGHGPGNRFAPKAPATTN